VSSERIVTNPRSIADIIEVFLRAGVDTIMCPHTKTCIREAIKEAEHGLAIDPDTVRPRKAERYRELVLSDAEPMPGALSILQLFHGHKTLALATSSYAESAYAVMGKPGIED